MLSFWTMVTSFRVRKSHGLCGFLCHQIIQYMYSTFLVFCTVRPFKWWQTAGLESVTDHPFSVLNLECAHRNVLPLHTSACSSNHLFSQRSSRTLSHQSRFMADRTNGIVSEEDSVPFMNPFSNITLPSFLLLSDISNLQHSTCDAAAYSSAHLVCWES